MTTPSSSTTTPSPQLRYAPSETDNPPQAISTNGAQPDDREQRERAVQKFLASAELSKLARGLRTRLSYATYKATHNLAHTTLHDLEAKVEGEPAPPRAPSTPSLRGNNYYNNPATQGNSAMAPTLTPKSAAKKGSMAPPPPVTASAGQSLFASILAPPPSKRARTIHNPQDPPVPPPEKPKALITLHKRTPKGKTLVVGTHQKAKVRKDDKGKRKETASRAVARVSSSSSQDILVDEEMDRKAAATLTSLMYSRPAMSVAASSSSPRSVASDSGSIRAFPHYAQGSSRAAAAATSGMQVYGRSTPPISQETQNLVRDSDMRFHGNSTPKPQARPPARPGGPATPQAPSDTEAADLMLFLATSPSPARPTPRNKDSAPLRTLGGSSGALQGRVLFGGQSGQEEHQSSATGPRPLRRDFAGSFSSTLSVVTEPASEAGYQAEGSEDSIMRSPSPSRSKPLPRDQENSMNLDVPQMPTVTPPTPTDQHPSQPLSQGSTSTSSSSGSMAAPPPPGLDHNRFLPASSSASRQGPSARLATGRTADIRRQVFEEHAWGPASSSRNRMPGQGSSLGTNIET